MRWFKRTLGVFVAITVAIIATLVIVNALPSDTLAGMGGDKDGKSRPAMDGSSQQRPEFAEGVSPDGGVPTGAEMREGGRPEGGLGKGGHQGVSITRALPDLGKDLLILVVVGGVFAILSTVASGSLRRKADRIVKTGSF